MCTGRSARFVKGGFVEWNTRVSCEAVTGRSSLADVFHQTVDALRPVEVM